MLFRMSPLLQRSLSIVAHILLIFVLPASLRVSAECSTDPAGGGWSPFFTRYWCENNAPFIATTGRDRCGSGSFITKFEIDCGVSGDGVFQGVVTSIWGTCSDGIKLERFAAPDRRPPLTSTTQLYPAGLKEVTVHAGDIVDGFQGVCELGATEHMWPTGTDCDKEQGRFLSGVSGVFRDGVIRGLNVRCDPIPYQRPLYQDIRWRQCATVFVPTSACKSPRTLLTWPDRGPAAPMSLTYAQVQSSGDLRIEFRGVARVTLQVMSIETGLSVIHMNTAPGDQQAFHFVLSSLAIDQFYGRDLTLVVGVTWRTTDNMYFSTQKDTPDEYPFTFRLETMTESRLNSLTFTAAGINKLTPSFVSTTFTYDVVLPRVATDPPFAVSFTRLDLTSTVSWHLFGPVSDNSESVSAARILASGTDSSSVQSALATLLNIPFGQSRLVTVVTAQNIRFMSTYVVNIRHFRNSDARIISLMSTLGRLAPIFTSSTTHYSLQQRVTDPAKSMRILLTLADQFANATARLMPAILPGTPLGALGTEIAVRSSQRSCSYQRMLQFVPSYGRSTLHLNVTADNGAWKLTSIDITKVSFRLLNLTTSQGQLTPPFSPTRLSYRLRLPNGQDSAVIRALRADPFAQLKWRLQSVASRRGPEPLEATEEVDNATRLLQQSVSLSDLPLGAASISVSVRASDGVQVTYTILLDRVVDSTLALSNPVFGSSMLGGSDLFFPTLSPTFNVMRTNYTLSVHAGVTSTILSFEFAHPMVELFAEWRDLRIRPRMRNSTYSLSLTGIAILPTLLRLQLLAPDRSVVQQYWIQVKQQMSDNAFLEVLQVSEGILTPSFVYDEFDYNLRLRWMDPAATNASMLPPLVVYAAKQHLNSSLVVHFLSSFFPDTQVPITITRMPASLLSMASLPASSIPLNDSLLELSLLAPDLVTRVVYRIHVRRTIPLLLPPLPAPNQWWLQVLQLVMVLSLDLSGIGDLDTARKQLAVDLARALEVDLVRIYVPRLVAGSVRATVWLMPSVHESDPTVLTLLLLLQDQLMHFQGSRLSTGELSQFIDLDSPLQVQSGCMRHGDFVESSDMSLCEETSQGGLAAWAVALISLSIFGVVTTVLSLTARWWLRRRHARRIKQVPEEAITICAVATPEKLAFAQGVVPEPQGGTMQARQHEPVESEQTAAIGCSAADGTGTMTFALSDSQHAEPAQASPSLRSDVCNSGVLNIDVANSRRGSNTDEQHCIIHAPKEVD